jgi:hypothetical protein
VKPIANLLRFHFSSPRLMTICSRLRYDELYYVPTRFVRSWKVYRKIVSGGWPVPFFNNDWSSLWGVLKVPLIGAKQLTFDDIADVGTGMRQKQAQNWPMQFLRSDFDPRKMFYNLWGCIRVEEHALFWQRLYTFSKQKQSSYYWWSIRGFLILYIDVL